MSRFSLVIDRLRSLRSELLKESKKRRAKAPSKKKPMKKIEFESEMLEEIFQKMPQDMQDLLKGKVQRK